MPLAIEVAGETGDPIGRILAQVLSEEGGPSMITEAESLLPPLGVALREVHAVVADQKYEATRRLSKRSRSKEALTRTAHAAEMLSLRLRDLGRYDDAYAAARN